MNGFFQSIDDATRTYRATMGLPEIMGTPPNAAEIEVHELIAAGVPAEAAVFHPRKAKHLRFWPRTPIQRLGYIEARIQQGCTPLPERSKA